MITLQLSNGGQKEGGGVCHLSKQQQPRFEESIVSEWDNSTESGMRKVLQLESRGCLSKWKRAVGRSECWLLQAGLLITHAFITIIMHSQVFHCTK